jgi:hypothetical protein
MGGKVDYVDADPAGGGGEEVARDGGDSLRVGVIGVVVR